jgi:phage-related baseplate assembly protein
MEAPVLISNDTTEIVAEIKAEYETRTGKVVAAGSPEMGLFNSIAYREGLVRSAIQSAGLQMLVPFSSAPILDALGQLVGVSRLSPANAQCNILLTLTSDHTDTIIPEGTRIQSQDGIGTFGIDNDVFVAAGTLTANISATSLTPGAAGNGFTAGQINNILDPHPFLVTAANTDTSAAGSDAETDDQLRARIMLAPASFSVAGPKDAYIFFAKSASSLIIDVAITQPVPGTVNVYPLVSGADVTPTEILDLVSAILNDDKIRPLTDTVNVIAPTKIEYTLTVHLTTITGTVAQDAIDAVTASLALFTQTQAKKMGRDVLGTKIKSLSMAALPDGIYDVALVGFTDLIIAETEYAYCTTLNITVTGSNGG